MKRRAIRMMSRFLVHLPHPRFFTGDQSLLDRVIRAGINQAYYSMSEEDIRRFNREQLWGGVAGKKWYELKTLQYSQDFAPFLEARGPFVSLIQEHCSVGYDTLCEIGTGSGAFLDYLSQAIPGIQRFIGLDINKEQIAVNQSVYPDLEFIHADAGEWVRSHGNSGTLFVATGTLEYFTRQELQELFQAIPSAIAIRDVGNWAGVSMPRGNTAFSHDYAYMATQAGFQVLQVLQGVNTLMVARRV